MINKKPDWIRVRVSNGKSRAEVEKMLRRLSLNTVCEEANCPNLLECFGRKTATFMILGNVCTRNCTFCNITKGNTEAVDPQEPLHVAQATAELGLKHVVITSVTRDDLADGGSSQFAKVIESIRLQSPGVIIEVLIPDFKGEIEALRTVMNAKPDILNHNVETVPALYSTVRPMAIYGRSLELLSNSKSLDSNVYTKSGIMLGLGETKEQVLGVLKDLREVNCDILTIGQYLAPSTRHHPVVEYVHPDIFEKYKTIAVDMGFMYVASGPLVRSSYMADKALDISETK